MAKAAGKGKISTILLTIAVVLISIVMIGVIVKMTRSETTKTVGGFYNYEIGLLDDTTGEELSGTSSIRTKDYVTTDGLTVEVKKDANVSYVIYFYDTDKEFLTKTETLTADYDGTAIPEGAEYAKIVITPNNDAEVSWNEINGYQNKLTVTVNK